MRAAIRTKIGWLGYDKASGTWVDIFLSYAREDLPRVKTVVKALEARGWSVWWDSTIEPGQKWDRVIETALDEARCVIVLWSLISAKSDWVRKEAAEGERKGILIPALLDNVVIPLAFRDIQAANLVGWAGAQPHIGFDELATAVSRKLPAGAQPARASVVTAPKSWWNLRRRVIAVGLTAGAVIGVAVYAGKSRGTASSLRAPEIQGAGGKYLLIRAGTFLMGCSLGDTECNVDEKPAHKVALTRDFYMGETDVTVGAYRRFADLTHRDMPEKPSFPQTDTHPVVNVIWDDADNYCRWDGGGRLPTEEEWEYAARAGNSQARYGNLDDIAWYDKNSGGGTHPVGQKQPNGFGLYDTLGNVWQWNAGWYGEYLPPRDPKGAAAAAGEYGWLRHPVRGGSWGDGSRDVRVSTRVGSLLLDRPIDLGFRCVREVP